MEAKIDRIIPEKGKLGTKARPAQAFGPSNLELGEKLSLSFPALTLTLPLCSTLLVPGEPFCHSDDLPPRQSAIGLDWFFTLCM